MTDASELLTRLGDRLRGMRRARGISQEEVGQRSGFSGKYISEIERGKRDVPISTLEAILESGLESTFAAFFSPAEAMPSLETIAPAKRERVASIIDQIVELAR